MTLLAHFLGALLLVVEADAAAPRGDADVIEAIVATAIAEFNEPIRSVGDLMNLPSAVPLISEANTALEEGVRMFVDVDLEGASEALDRAIDLYREAGGDLWRSPSFARANLFRGITSLASGAETDAGKYFVAALAVDPTLSLASGTYAPQVVDAFEKSRAAFLTSGFQPKPPEIWGSAARRLGADGIVLVRVQRVASERRVAMIFLKVAPDGAVETRARVSPQSNAERHVRKAALTLLELAIGPRPKPKWRKWAWIGGGTLVTLVGGIAFLAAQQPRLDTTVVIPTPISPQ